MKRKNYDIEVEDFEIYEPVNSKYREQMFMKWRMEDKGSDYTDNKKVRKRKASSRRRHESFQHWL